MLNVTQTVFIASGESESASELARLLEMQGYSPRVFDDAEVLLHAAEREPPALFLLGGMLRNVDGVSLCRRLRRVSALAKTPIIFVGRASENDRIIGLEAGADDSLAQPYGPRELAARLKAVLRRYDPRQATERLKVGPLSIDCLAMTVALDDREVPLTVTEFRLLEHLARNRGRVLTRVQLLAVLWHGSGNVTPRAIDVYVRRVRAKIERDPENPVYLTTVRGAGYRLNGPNSMDNNGLGA